MIFQDFISLSVFIFLGVTSTTAFDSGTIPSNSQSNGVNYRHGNLEDSLKDITLDIKPRGKLSQLIGGVKLSQKDIRHIYFGNWLRDYNQILDTGMLQLGINEDLLVFLVGAFANSEFGSAGGDFEVTQNKLGVYRPEEHIDNPAGYAQGRDARKYDQRLRGPVSPQELLIDPNTGMKNYIANESGSWTTSSSYLRQLATQSIAIGRTAVATNNRTMLVEAYRQLGQTLHTLEDWSAHSNYCELTLIDLGYSNVFPHVGSDTRINLNGKIVYPIVTGSFGTTDFLHSLLGSAEDEVGESNNLDTLEGSLNQTIVNKQVVSEKLKIYLSLLPDDAQDTVSSNAQSYLIRDFRLLKKFDYVKNIYTEQAASDHDSGLGKQVKRGQTILENTIDMYLRRSELNVKPEEISKLGAIELVKRAKSVFDFQNAVMKSVDLSTSNAETSRDYQRELNTVFSNFSMSVLQPYLASIIWDVRAALRTLSFEISDTDEKQWAVWDDANSTTPTHSQLSKDHFGIYLNEPAGQVAEVVVGHAASLIIQAWDDSSIDPNKVVGSLLETFHHPTMAKTPLQLQMRSVMSDWINQVPNKDRIVSGLSSCGVRNGYNHLDSTNGIVDPNSARNKC